MYYCGTDIIEVARIKKAIEETEGFLEKVYSSAENKMGIQKGEKAKYQYYAGRFAAKEAVYKATSAAMGLKSIEDIEILNEDNGRPYAVIAGKKADNVDVSISHIEKYATAIAIYAP